MLTEKIRIGLFDSGIGGFSVLFELFKKIPQAEYFYVADSAYAPYGPKTDEEILQRSFQVVSYLKEKQVDLIVIACNTATAVSIDSLRKNDPDFTYVGVEPYLKSFQHLENVDVKKMVVLTTISTGKSERFKRLKNKLDPDGNIAHISLPQLANLVEEGARNGFHANLKLKVAEEIKDVRRLGFKHAILGCTHYPLVAKWIEELTHAEAVSPCPYVANRVWDLLVNKNEWSERLKTSSTIEDQKYFYFFETSADPTTQKWKKELRQEFKDKLPLTKTN